MAVLPILIGASIAAASVQPTLPPAQPVRQAPAMWVVNDDDTIIYLFGTFHALDERSDWFGPAVQTAFSASDQLILETLVPRPPKIGYAGPNTGNLGPAIRPQHQPGTMAQLAPSASFLATSKLVMSAGRTKGLSTANGADAVLRDVAEGIGKPVGGLETFESQLVMFNSLPGGPSGAAAPPQTPQEVHALSSVLSSLQSAWRRGDIDTFAPMLRQMQDQSPASYKAMFTDRNERWAGWIANRMKSPGTVFVAVGAGHLAGPDSVQNKLAALGVRSARLN